MRYKSTLKNNTILLTFGTIVNKGFQFIAVYLYSRWLSIEQYGEFDVLCTYISLLLPVITLSTQEAMFRLAIENEQSKKKYISSALVFDLLLFFIASVVIVLVFPNKREIAILFSFYLLSEEMATYLRGVLRTIKRLDLFSYGMVLQTAFIFLFSTLFILKFELGLKGILLGYAIGTFLGDIFLFVSGKWYLFFRFSSVSLKSVKEMTTYSIPLIPNEISWWVMNASDRQIINLFFGDSANGIYAIAHKIPAICSLIFNMFSISWQQEIVERVERKEISETNIIFNKFIAVLATFCSIVVASNYFFFYYFWDKKYFLAINYAPILIFAAFEIAIIQFMGGIQTAFKQTKSIGKSTVLGGAFNVIIHLILIRYIGLYAAAISTAISNFIIIVVRHFNVSKYIKLRLNPLNVGLIAVFIYFVLTSFYHLSLVFSIINLLLSLIVCACVNKNFLKSLLNR